MAFIKCAESWAELFGEKGVIVERQTQINTHHYTNMEFTQDNKVIQLCAKGMELEGHGQRAEASAVFYEAWDVATTDFEKFTAAHYVARHQKNIPDKLHWDKEALKYALQIDGEAVKGTLPSLYLNIGTCYEDLSDFLLPLLVKNTNNDMCKVIDLI